MVEPIPSPYACHCRLLEYTFFIDKTGFVVELARFLVHCAGVTSAQPVPPTPVRARSTAVSHRLDPNRILLVVL